VKAYKVVAILWEDHSTFDRSPLSKNPEEVIRPTLTIGFIYKKTKKTLTVVHDLERYQDRDDASYTVIYNSSICSIKEYGRINIESIRT
jgi:hypothetical protein